MSKKNNKKRGKFLFSLIIIFVLMFITINASSGNDEDTVFYVNDEPVHKEEILESAKNLSSAVRNEILTTYEIEPDKFSWDYKVEGSKKAIDILNDKVIDKVTYDKIIQIESKEKGLIDKIDYNSIKKELEKENEKRFQNKLNNEIVYGTTEFGFSEYYQYMNSNLSIQLRKILIDEGVLKVKDKELESIYKDNKNMFQSQDEETVELELMPFEKVKSSVMDLGLNKKFDQYINNKVKNASIKMKNEEGVVTLLEELLV